MTAEEKLIYLEAEIVGKIAKEEDLLPTTTGHIQSIGRGYLEALEWVQEQFVKLRNGEEL